MEECPISMFHVEAKKYLMKFYIDLWKNNSILQQCHQCGDSNIEGELTKMTQLGGLKFMAMLLRFIEARVIVLFEDKMNVKHRP